MQSGARYAKKKHEVLLALSDRFERDRRYSEGEVDALTAAFVGTLEGVSAGDERFEITHLRRGLVEMGLLARERNGSAYWVRS